MSAVDSASASPEVPFFNIFDPEFDFNSAEMTAAQDRSWYASSPVGLLVLRYAEVQELLRDRRLDHNGKRYMEQTCGVFSGPAYDWFVPMIVNREGEDHLRLRRLMNKTFTPRMIDDLRPFIRAQADRLTDQIASAGQCEFDRDFATQLPLAVMCHMLGVPPDDYDTFRVWGSDIGLVFSMGRGGDIPARVESAVTGLSGYADSLVERKAAAPADDVISALVAARQASKVTDEELRNLVVTLVFAAYETTRQQFVNAMAAFAAHPAQWAMLGSHPELGGQAADEAIRWCPSATSVSRYAAEDFAYHDLLIARNTYMMMCVPTAQRDPRVFRDGQRFDITIRRGEQPLQFGGGPHYCLGAALAQAELSEALPILASRLGTPRITGPVSWRPAVGVHGPIELPLSFW